MKKTNKGVEVLLAIPDDVRKALCDAHALAENNPSVKSELKCWMSGAHGSVLAAERLKRDPETGAFVAVLEFTKPFLEFLTHELHIPLSEKDWKRRCTKELVRLLGLGRRKARRLADSLYADCHEDCTPEQAAEFEASYWREEHCDD